MASSSKKKFDIDFEEPPPWSILYGPTANLLKWRKINESIKVTHQATVTPAQSDLRIIFPKKTRYVISHACKFGAGVAAYWTFRFALTQSDLLQSHEDFENIVQGRSPSSQVAFFAAKHIKCNLNQKEATMVSEQLAEILSRIPINLKDIHPGDMKVLFQATLVEALPDRAGIQSFPYSIALKYSRAKEQGIIGQRRNSPCVYTYFPVENSQLAHEEPKLLKIFVDPLALKGDDMRVPEPHPFFKYAVTETLKNWEPNPLSEEPQPTKSQIERATKVLLHIISELCLCATTESDVLRVSEGIKSVYCTGVVDDKSKHRSALRYRGSPLFTLSERQSSGAKFVVPSSHMQKDAGGWLPPIPVTSGGVGRRVDKAIEEIWVQTKIRLKTLGRLDVVLWILTLVDSNVKTAASKFLFPKDPFTTVHYAITIVILRSVEEVPDERFGLSIDVLGHPIKELLMT
ncbi:hypothetical protein DL98DRAFT_537700 [Cadophora sp. DSE1049]|nr:hypothetical protein DL98DRAFT_537700 [Cadophora sp. DSE1049]